MTLESTLPGIFSFISSKELIVVLIAMLPVAGLRLSIPLAIMKEPYGFGLDP